MTPKSSCVFTCAMMNINSDARLPPENRVLDSVRAREPPPHPQAAAPPLALMAPRGTNWGRPYVCGGLGEDASLACWCRGWR